MAHGDPARLTAREGRRFAWTMVGAITMLALLCWWRDRTTIALSLGALAVSFALAAITIPDRLGPVRRGWLAVGERISRVTTPVVYTVVYLVVITPIGIARRRIGRSPLARDPGASTYWVPRERSTVAERRASMERQF